MKRKHKRRPDCSSLLLRARVLVADRQGLSKALALLPTLRSFFSQLWQQRQRLGLDTGRRANLGRNIIIACGLVAAVAVYLFGGMSYRSLGVPPSFQGYMEGELVLIGPEGSGRITAVFVKQGDEVAADQDLFQLDNTYETQQQLQAKGVLAQARADLKNLQSEQMRRQEIDVLLANERSAIAAQELSKEELDRRLRLFEKKVIPRSQLDAAQSAFNRDRAALDAVRSQISVGHLAAREQQIDSATARVAAAKAALRQTEIKLTKRAVKSPVAGRVEELNFRAGEVVAAGQPVLALLPPGNIKVRFFVAETKLSQLAIGTVVGIHCDGCAADLAARVDYIARQAEFTPPIIYGPKERAKLVFRVEARPEGAAVKLSPGQPVTVTPLPPRSI